MCRSSVVAIGGSGRGGVVHPNVKDPTKKLNVVLVAKDNHFIPGCLIL